MLQRIAARGGTAAAVLLAISTSSLTARAQTAIEVPEPRGDQLLFVYDARTARVPYLIVSNPAASPIVVEIALYPETAASALGRETRELEAGANTIINPASDLGGVANGQAGLAVVTPVADTSDATPVVPPEPLIGGYTLANTSLLAGFGENPMGRLAVDGEGARAAAGAEVDGSLVRYQRFAPSALAIPVYYDPNDLAPPANDGNRVILAAFGDSYGDRFDITPASVTLAVSFHAGDGSLITARGLTVSGVDLSNLQEIASGVTLDTSGKVFFNVQGASAVNLFGIFAQSLGTFASGGRMPAVEPVPVQTPSVTPTPRPSQSAGGVTPTPGLTPSGSCGNNVAEGDEDCDGTDLDDFDCEDLVGGLDICFGDPTCNPDCTFNVSACRCSCESDFDCDWPIDCNAVVPDCELFGACDGELCITASVGTPDICNGSDPDDPETQRCE